MTTAGVSGMMFQSVFEGSLSMQDMEVERRPYHKNCTCALHKSKGGVCSNAVLKKGTFPFQRNCHGPTVPCACRQHPLPHALEIEEVWLGVHSSALLQTIDTPFRG